MQQQGYPMADDLTFSPIIAGMMRVREWGLSASELRDWMQACIDMGITTFDHADIYGGYHEQRVVGEAMTPELRTQMQIISKANIQLLADDRPDIKVHHYNSSAEHLIASAEKTLRDLNIETIDLLLIHRPDPLLNADEVAYALKQLHQQGKVRYFGVSNFMPHHFDLLQSRLDVPLITNQIELSVTYLDHLHNGVLDQCQQKRLHPLVWGPMAGGRIFRRDDEQTQRIGAILDSIAQEWGCGVDEVALAWVLMHPTHPIPIMGTGKLDRLQSALNAYNRTMTRQQWFAIWEASMGHEVP
jgi:predicted oxidoreductase